jgi:hypothetical protein
MSPNKTSEILSTGPNMRFDSFIVLPFVPRGLILQFWIVERSARPGSVSAGESLDQQPWRSPITEMFSMGHSDGSKLRKIFLNRDCANAVRARIVSCRSGDQPPRLAPGKRLTSTSRPLVSYLTPVGGARH